MNLKNFDRKYKEEGFYQTRLRWYRRWWRERNWRMLAECVEDDDIVLDLASGPGLLGGYILERGGLPVGVDSSMEAVTLSRDSREQVYPGKMTEIPFRDNAFDIVLCSLSLHYLKPAELVVCFDEIKRVLHSKGRFAFSYPNVLVKPPAADAVELEWEVLGNFLRNSGFGIGSRVGISPFLPNWLVNLAQTPYFWLLWPYLEWRAIEVFSRPDEAYHYLVKSYAL